MCLEVSTFLLFLLFSEGIVELFSYFGIWFLFVLFCLYYIPFILLFLQILVYQMGNINLIYCMREDDDITVKKWEIYNWKTIITTIETEIY